MKRRKWIQSLSLLALACLSGACSAFTSIKEEPDGRFVLTGWRTPGPVGFVWVGEYDPATRTLTIVEKH